MSKSRSEKITKLKESISGTLSEIEKQLDDFELAPESIDHEKDILRMRNRYHRLGIILQCLNDKKISEHTQIKLPTIASHSFTDQLQIFVKTSARGKDEMLDSLTILQGLCHTEMEFLHQKIKNLGGYVFEKIKQTPAIVPEIRTPLDSPHMTPANTPSSSPRPSFRRNFGSRGLFDTPRNSPASTPRGSITNEPNDEKSADREGSHAKTKPGKNPSKD